MRRALLDKSYFESLYSDGDGDPWRFATSEYEQGKYAATLAALPATRYARALEIGCSIGVLTKMLAPRCDELVATEPVARALDQARARCAECRNVRFEQAQAPGEWDSGTFDLILISEVIYYLTADVVGTLAQRVNASLRPGGHVLLVHWIGETDYPLSGDDAVAIFTSASPSLRIIRQERNADYRLDLFQAADDPVPSNVAP